jgi:hypothetical protein
MIRYSLVCDRQHSFDAWFNSSSDYDRQARRRLVTCPACGSARVEKALMAPSISHAGRPAGRREAAPNILANEPAPSPAPETNEPVAMLSPQEREVRAKLKELREHLTKNADNVGKKFPEEARQMHYGEIEHRSIYGEASPQDAKDLHDEGIEFYPLPVLPDERN